MVRMLWLLALTIVAFVLSGIASFYLDLSQFVVFAPTTALIFISLTVFTISFLFFGFPAPFMMLLTGIYIGWLIKVPNMEARVGGLIVSSLMACFASIKLGDALLDDITGKGNFRDSLKVTTVAIAVAVIVALSIDLLVVT